MHSQTIQQLEVKQSEEVTSLEGQLHCAEDLNTQKTQQIASLTCELSQLQAAIQAKDDLLVEADKREKALQSQLDQRSEELNGVKNNLEVLKDHQISVVKQLQEKHKSFKHFATAKEESLQNEVLLLQNQLTDQKILTDQEVKERLKVEVQLKSVRDYEEYLKRDNLQLQNHTDELQSKLTDQTSKIAAKEQELAAVLSKFAQSQASETKVQRQFNDLTQVLAKSDKKMHILENTVSDQEQVVQRLTTQNKQCNLDL